MMRILLTLLGIVAIIVYAMLGATLMNDWAVVAASEMPLETTIADMHAAGQNYSTIPGFVFAALGLLLGLLWGVTTLFRRTVLPNWAAVSLWAGVITLGAPAYFFMSFGNLNSVGDTYFDWNSEAAFALEAPLYMASGLAFLVVVAMMMVTADAPRIPTASSTVQSQNQHRLTLNVIFRTDPPHTPTPDRLPRVRRRPSEVAVNKKKAGR